MEGAGNCGVVVGYAVGPPRKPKAAAERGSFLWLLLLALELRAM